MQMKKFLIVLLTLILILGGIFFWKGGHHAIILAEAIEEWLDADDADQALTLMVQMPDFLVNDAGELVPQIRQFSLDAETFWTEYADRPIFGVTAQGMTAYTDGKNLYMDTGRTYALPRLEEAKKSAGRLALGLLLHGRVTRDGDSYHIEMKTEEMELYADLTADRVLHAANLTVMLENEISVNASMTTLPTNSHTLPRTVIDAMVQSNMAPPMSLVEPLNVLLPAMERLIPLEGDLTLGIECGILELSETVRLRMDAKTAEIQRKGVTVTLSLPLEPSRFEPLGAVLLLLQNGDYQASEQGATVTLTLPPEETASLCAALVPQTEGLGLSFEESRLTLSIADGKLQKVALTAGGSVPLVITTIPLTFLAELNIP